MDALLVDGVQDGQSGLHIACKHAHMDLVEYLCEVGGDKLLVLSDRVREHTSRCC